MYHFPLLNDKYAYSSFSPLSAKRFIKTCCIVILCSCAKLADISEKKQSLLVCQFKFRRSISCTFDNFIFHFFQFVMQIFNRFFLYQNQMQETARKEKWKWHHSQENPLLCARRSVDGKLLWNARASNSQGVLASSTTAHHLQIVSWRQSALQYAT